MGNAFQNLFAALFHSTTVGRGTDGWVAQFRIYRRLAMIYSSVNCSSTAFILFFYFLFLLLLFILFYFILFYFILFFSLCSEFHRLASHW